MHKRHALANNLVPFATISNSQTIYRTFSQLPNVALKVLHQEHFKEPSKTGRKVHLGVHMKSYENVHLKFSFLMFSGECSLTVRFSFGASLVL